MISMLLINVKSEWITGIFFNVISHSHNWQLIFKFELLTSDSVIIKLSDEWVKWKSSHLWINGVAENTVNQIIEHSTTKELSL